ncbi:uncharacterized protein B0I36DRAFT_348841 [Microdochium trichocladiopsis]|uniref:Alcohol acetyltransferase-domain-containing protein n=1 Tax=Microdochium trichocladiopsis TaxID=1682393 RepID=A0A9P9BQ90_9PEZI|nr:uncharacterized protein B0I36DRAFT_348841 [Microdochium trichocladiopsis]KAH7030635.1 hypothetical protein B0I36DRAFT_348841 [Microdochium trichocladiopsis]
MPVRKMEPEGKKKTAVLACGKSRQGPMRGGTVAADAMRIAFPSHCLSTTPGPRLVASDPRPTSRSASRDASLCLQLHLPRDGPKEEQKGFLDDARDGRRRRRRPASTTIMRYASPNELRTISREDLGWYDNVVLGAIYTFAGHDTSTAGDLLSPAYYYAAVRQVVERHPFLSVVVKDKHTDKAYYEHVPSVSLKEHIFIASQDEQGRAEDETARIERLLPSLVDHAHAAERPPWSVTVLPLGQGTGQTTRLFIAFAFSHMLGDGMNGLTFHQHLLEGLRDASTNADASSATTVTIPPTTTLDEPFDTPKRLPISWGYLLGPLFAVLLPKWLAILLGVRASTSTLEPGTWIGPPMFDDNKADPTRLRIIDIPAAQVEAALRTSRRHGAKLTGVLHQVIVHALSDALPGHTLPSATAKGNKNREAGSNNKEGGGGTASSSTAITRFVSQSAINMRPTLGIPNTKMGLYVNGCFDYHPRRVRASRTFSAQSSQQSSQQLNQQDGPLTEAEWAAAAATTQKLALSAATLADQPIGLLRYAPSVRGWMAKKMGQKRDCSYEVSNLLAFSPPPPPAAAAAVTAPAAAAAAVEVEWIVFAQPRNPTSSPLVFDVVSVKGGNLVISVVWQAGALGDVTRTLEGEQKLVGEISKGCGGRGELDRGRLRPRGGLQGGGLSGGSGCCDRCGFGQADCPRRLCSDGGREGPRPLGQGRIDSVRYVRARKAKEARSIRTMAITRNIGACETAEHLLPLIVLAMTWFQQDKYRRSFKVQQSYRLRMSTLVQHEFHMVVHMAPSPSSGVAHCIQAPSPRRPGCGVDME